MKVQLNLVKEFHKKFNVPIKNEFQLINEDRFNLRFNLMQEEVNEYLNGNKNKDKENIAKEIADILYSVYGTILEHGLQNKIEDIFMEVHKSNMSKDYAQFKMIKGKNYFKADIKKVLNT